MPTPANGHSARSALVIEQFDALAALEEAILRRGGFNVTVSRRIETAIHLMKAAAFDVVLLSSPDRRGSTPLLEWIVAERHPGHCVIVVTTTPHDPEFLATASRAGVYRVLPKPFSVDELLEAATDCVSQAAAVPPPMA